MYATCFGVYVGRPQACQYKNHAMEDAIKIERAPFLQSLCL